MKKGIFIFIVAVYFVMNIINTYFLSLEQLNEYIVTFDQTFLGNISSILGNLAVLGIFFIIGRILFRNDRRLSIYLLIITLILNAAVIGIQYYNKGYKLAFSFFNFNLIKNPAGGFGSNVFLDWMHELFVNYRIINLIPFFLILFVLIAFRKKFDLEKKKLNIKRIITALLLLSITQVGTFAYYKASMKDNWGYSTEYAQYGIQYCGAYNYYISELAFQIDNRNIKSDKTVEERYEDISLYNKNVNEYTNIIDNKKYSNKDKQTGILKDKNVFVIQMESTMNFVMNTSFNGIEVTPYLNKFVKEDENCFYFNNAYTTIGIGNTSDAELAFFTGYYPTGDMTIAWEYELFDFDMTAITEIIDDQYYSHSYNGTDEIFYNHNKLHEKFYGVDNFRGLDTFKKDFPRKNNEDKYFHYWISDESILNWAVDTAQEKQENGNKSFAFVETITPHNPFPNYSEQIEGFSKDWGLSGVNDSLSNYVSMLHYNDKFIYEFLMDVTNPESDNYLEDTVFVLYGDHGNNLAKDCYDDLFKRDLTDLEYAKMVLNIPIIFYDPSGTIKESLEGEDIDYILSQTKSNTDIFRTLINLLGIETDINYYGVNMFSGEPTFSYDPKNFNIVTDDFIYCYKNSKYELFGDTKSINKDIINYVLDFRMKQDDYVNTLVYKAPEK
ncbi:MAG: sulfatase-like hydrolase/transferase [Acholeplasmatales bacterium]|nr:sulfatase-like hydrolase/transferase [Acholeplasmatales bacterium]